MPVPITTLMSILLSDCNILNHDLYLPSPSSFAITHPRPTLELSYEVSIDIDKAFGRRTDTLIVYEMNGHELPRDHGCARAPNCE